MSFVFLPVTGSTGVSLDLQQKAMTVHIDQSECSTCRHRIKTVIIPWTCVSIPVHRGRCLLFLTWALQKWLMRVSWSQPWRHNRPGPWHVIVRSKMKPCANVIQHSQKHIAGTTKVSCFKTIFRRSPDLCSWLWVLVLIYHLLLWLLLQYLGVTDLAIAAVYDEQRARINYDWPLIRPIQCWVWITLWEWRNDDDLQLRSRGPTASRENTSMNVEDALKEHLPWRIHIV